MKILLIEDDIDVSFFIKMGLQNDGIVVDIAKDGASGSFMSRTNHYDVMVIDYSLPIKDGLSICEEIRASQIDTPIIFLTVHTDTRKKVRALEKGADDYMTKPFALEELKARLFALKRRPHQIESTILTVDDLVVDTYKRTVKRNGKQIYLTRKTYDLLEHLMRNKGIVLSRGNIMEYVWNSDSDPFSNTVESHISSLRKKINIDGKKDILKNLPGRGYIIIDS
jgi:DNA-binding response OmpR family regulator